MSRGVTCPYCDSWSSGPWEWRGRKSDLCPECSAGLERIALVGRGGVSVRDVNKAGLGDRRGLAIERVTHRVEKLSMSYDETQYVVYLDGVELFRRPTWEAAYRDGAQRARGRMGQ